MSKKTFATVWLDGCSGCHMSFLDMDERLLELAQKVDVICSPYVDAKGFPDAVDITIVEGAIGNEDDLHKIKKIRKNSKIVISFGDCCVTGNVSAMRNIYGKEECLNRAYIENVDLDPHIPTTVIPPLCERVKPAHEVIKVDVFLPGCPPPADAIYYVLTELLEGREPDPALYTRFGK